MKYLKLANKCEGQLSESAIALSMLVLHNNGSHARQLAHKILKLYRIINAAMRLTKMVDKRGKSAYNS